MRSAKLFALTCVAASSILAGCATSGGSSNLTTQAQLDPVKSEQIAQHAVVRLKDGRTKEAGGYASVALSLDPTNIKARRVAAKAALALNRPEQAIQHYAHLRETETDAEIEGLLGLAYLRTGDDETAKSFLMSSLAQDKTRWREAVALAGLERDSGDLEKARGLLKLAEEHSDNPYLVSLAIGRVELRRGRYDEALIAFDRAQSLSGGMMEIDADYRVALAQTGQIERAFDNADATTRSRIHRELGRSAIQRNDKREAVAQLKRAISTSPRHDTESEILLKQALDLEG